MTMPLAEISFSLNLGQFISLPILVAIVGAIVWLKKQINPIEATLATIAATVQASIDERFTVISDQDTKNQTALLVQLAAINTQVTATNGRVTVLEQVAPATEKRLTAVEQEQRALAMQLANLQGRADERTEMLKGKTS